MLHATLEARSHYKLCAPTHYTIHMHIYTFFYGPTDLSTQTRRISCRTYANIQEQTTALIKPQGMDSKS